MKSVLQSEKVCYVCGTTLNLHDHHCLYGTSNRKQAEKYGLKVWLCASCHTGSNGVHFNKRLDLHLKQLSQRYFEEHYGSREDFRRIFGKSLL